LEERYVTRPSDINTVCKNCEEYKNCDLYGDKLHFILDKILYADEESEYINYFDKYM